MLSSNSTLPRLHLWLALEQTRRIQLKVNQFHLQCAHAETATPRRAPRVRRRRPAFEVQEGCGGARRDAHRDQPSDPTAGTLLWAHPVPPQAAPLVADG